MNLLSSQTRHGGMDPAVLPVIRDAGSVRPADAQRLLSRFNYDDDEIVELLDSMVKRDRLELFDHKGEDCYRLSRGGSAWLDQGPRTFDRRVGLVALAFSAISITGATLAGLFEGHPGALGAAIVIGISVSAAAAMLVNTAHFRNRVDPLRIRMREQDTKMESMLVSPPASPSSTSD